MAANQTLRLILALGLTTFTGRTQVLSMLVVAMPLKAVMAQRANEPLHTMSGSQYRGAVTLKGLCGDVWLSGVPAGPRLADFKIATSTRRGTIAFDAALRGLAAGGRYVLSAAIDDRGREVAAFKSPPFRAADLKQGRMAFAARWVPEKLWNVHTPQNTYRASLSLADVDGKLLDTSLPERFGFREFWIHGRDFYINGAPIRLCAVPFDNCGLGAAWAGYDGAKETMLRLMTFGVNCICTHSYGCAPGDHLSYEETMRAADDVGRPPRGSPCSIPGARRASSLRPWA
jgi:hypothetical protein